jgi:hypothetical protein
MLGYELGLLILCAAEEPELGLDSAKQMISQKWFNCCSKGWKVGCKELSISAQGFTSSFSSAMASTIGVGHKQVQQLSLLIP